jgi:hypothetical protein
MDGKVSPGDKANRPSAHLHNVDVDIRNHWLREGPWKQLQQPSATPRNYSKTKVRNSTGGNLRRGEVVEFSDFVFTQIKPDALWFVGTTPDLTNVGWGVTLKPIVDGEIGECLVLGICIAHVMIEDESHEYAAREDGETVLKSQASVGPVKILHKPTGGTPPEERECVVQIMDETGEPNVVLADFRAHEDSPTYAYPLPSDQNDDMVFPAFIQRGVTFDDETGFDVDQELTLDGGFSSDDEPVFVYSLRRTYIPPNPTYPHGQTLRPIIKINDKWYCNYTPVFRLSFGVSTISASTSGTTRVFEAPGSTHLSEGIGDTVTDPTYAPITVSSGSSSAGVITAHRKCTALVSLTLYLELSSFSGSSSINGYIQPTSGSTAVVTRLPLIHYVFLPPGSGITYQSGTRLTLSSRGYVQFDAGETLQFEIVNTGGTVVPSQMIVTVEPVFDGSH